MKITLLIENLIYFVAASTNDYYLIIFDYSTNYSKAYKFDNSVNIKNIGFSINSSR